MKTIALLLLAALATACDPTTVACPTPTTCGPVMPLEVPPPPPGPPDARYPFVSTIHTASITWSIDCGTPEDISAGIRDAVQWWNLQVQGILAAEGACDTGQIRAGYRPQGGAAGGIGGPNFVHVLRADLTPPVLATVLRHEFGHAIGIGHVVTPRCLMYWEVAAEDFGAPVGLCDYEQQMLIDLYPQGVQ